MSARRQEILFLLRIKSLGVQYTREEFRRHQHVNLSRAQEYATVEGMIIDILCYVSLDYTDILQQY